MAKVGLLALHGFAGAGEDFKVLASLTKARDFLWHMPDLPGHGSNTLSEAKTGSLSFASTAAFIREEFDRLRSSERWLLGYSMGGRLALYAVATGRVRPDRLILIGASPGISNEGARAERRQVEEAWATSIETDGMLRFAAYWESLPIIQSQEQIPDPLKSDLRQRRGRQNGSQMAGIMRNLGSGKMPPLWEELNRIGCPVELITGEHDLKFSRIAEQMCQHLPDARHWIIPEAGHTAHLENAHAIVRILEGRCPGLAQEDRIRSD